MEKGRLEAFSDGVIAILITIMVLELRMPEGSDWASLRLLVPTISSYVLSFLYLGIYWNNHHHLFRAIERVDGRTLWANLHLLFWLSLVPAGTRWIGETHFAPLPVAIYGGILLMSGTAYFLLTRALLAIHGKNSLIARALGRDFKGKISMVFYAVAIVSTAYQAWIACAVYVLVAIIWLVPDRRIEKKIAQ